MAPALSARSTLSLASRNASMVLPRTYVSILTSAGTELTEAPPLVMMGWMRILSQSR